ncbi:MAG: ABC transporter ATP-binding protein [Neomegalonema sp.]|nr:ABC transporter ATP-binding protein [Neomegalonema sp.]
MSISLKKVVKRFNGAPAVNAVDLEIADGEFFVILGPSGCGKSTLLRLIAGLEHLDAGEIRIDDERVSGDGVHTPPEQRRVGMVFQSYALWPHMSVLENVAFPIETTGASRREAKAQAQTHLATVALQAYAARKPAALSGGQRQRVALARCLAGAARVILMDEPLANLDPHLRAAMEDEISTFHRQAGAATLYITHDQREAMAMADRVAVMQAGALLQVGQPDEIYERPLSADVARFVGRGALIEAQLTKFRGEGAARRAEIQLGARRFEVAAAAETQFGRGQVLLRPEQVRLGGADGTPAKVRRATYRGGVWDVLVEAENVATPLEAMARRRVSPGETVYASIIDGWALPNRAHTPAD